MGAVGAAPWRHPDHARPPGRRTTRTSARLDQRWGDGLDTPRRQPEVRQVGVAELVGCRDAAAGIAAVMAALPHQEIRIASYPVSARTADRVDGTDFLNSFIADDLALVADAVHAGRIGAALCDYLRPDAELDLSCRIDVQRDLDAVLDATAARFGLLEILRGYERANPPRSWAAETAAFRSALERVVAIQADRELAYRSLLRLSRVEQDLATAGQALAAAEQQAAMAQTRLGEAQQAARAGQAETELRTRLRVDHRQFRPGLWGWLTTLGKAMPSGDAGTRSWPPGSPRPSGRSAPPAATWPW